VTLFHHLLQAAVTTATLRALKMKSTIYQYVHPSIHEFVSL